MDRVFFEPLIDRWYALALSITEPITIQEEQAYQDMLAKQFDLSQIQAFISSNSGLCKQQEPASRASFSTFKPRCL